MNGYEDISFTYGPTLSDGDGGFLTVGAEDMNGNSGDNYYVDGDGMLPVNGTDVLVTSIPSVPGETHTITFSATGKKKGKWENCAEMVGGFFFGTSLACAEGEVTK